MTGRASEGRPGDLLRASDILEALLLLDDVRKLGWDRFARDPIVQAAAVRYLEIVGEAAGHLSGGFRDRHPDVPVRRMRGLASFAKHEYWRIDPEKVWRAVEAAPKIRTAMLGARDDGPPLRE